MSPRRSRRWWVPLIAVGTIVVPATLAMLFPNVTSYGGFGGCSFCHFCVHEAPIRRIDVDVLEPDPDEGQEPSGNAQPDLPAGVEEELRSLPPGGKIPESVQRPRIDPNLPQSPGYKKSPAPKY